MDRLISENQDINGQLSDLFFSVIKSDLDNSYKPKVISGEKLLRATVSNINDTRGLSILSAMTQARDGDIKDLATKIASENLELIMNRLTPDDEACPQALMVLGSLMSSSSIQNKNTVLPQLQDKLTVLLDNSKNFLNQVAAVDYSIQYGNEETKEKAKNILKGEISLLGNVERKREVDLINGQRTERNILKFLLDSKNNNTFIEVMKLVNEHLKSYGLDGYSLMQTWKHACEPQVFEVITMFNLATINDIEKQNPGLSAKLFKDNHIANFARYPLNLLLSQKSEIEGGKVMQIVSTQEDHNGAFYDHHDFRIFQKLTDKLSDSFHIQVFEVSTEHPELPAKTTISDIGILNIHGEPKTLLLGHDKDGNKTKITANDIKGNSKLLGLGNIKKDSRLILASCSTGHVFEDTTSGNKGIGHQLSEELNILISAPVKPGGMADIEFSDNGNGHVLIPKFMEPNFENIQIKTSYFKNGDIVNEEIYKEGPPDLL